MSEPFSKNSSISDEYEYLNIQIKGRIRIRAISGIQIYLDICFVNKWHPSIFEYSFGT